MATLLAIYIYIYVYIITHEEMLKTAQALQAATPHEAPAKGPASFPEPRACQKTCISRSPSEHPKKGSTCCTCLA